MGTPLYYTLLDIRQKLLKTHGRLVLGESCTSGLVAAELGQVPGISEVFCGSQVVYQTESKTSWLGIDPIGLSDAARGPVSDWASEQLSRALLERTPHATIAAAITGHLGPNAPQNLDGAVYFALADRTDRFEHQSIFLSSPPPSSSNDLTGRRARQQEACNLFLHWIAEQLWIAEQIDMT